MSVYEKCHSFFFAPHCSVLVHFELQKFEKVRFSLPAAGWPTAISDRGPIKEFHGERASSNRMLAKLFDLEDYAGTYRETRNAYLKAANQLKLATGPYKAARDAYVAATATYTKSLYE